MGRRVSPRLLLAALLCAVAWAPAPAAETARPSYCLAEHWPDLPAGFELGQAAGLDINSKDVVYVFHRGSKTMGWKPSFADRVLARIARLFGGETGKAPIAEDTILAIHPQSGALLASFGAGRFRRPHGLSIDGEDNIWVTDRDLHQVFKFSRDGELLLALGEAGRPGAGPARFNGPTDVAVARDGTIYVADGYGNARVVKFSADGAYLLEWGGRGAEPGRFDLPHGIAIDEDGHLYVADRGNARIQVFDRDGRFLRQIAGPEIGRPWAVDVGRDGYLYAVDGGDLDPDKPRSGLLVLTRDGEVIARWSGFGYQAGQLVWPHDLAVSTHGEVFVGEVFGPTRVQKFRPECGPAAPADDAAALSRAGSQSTRLLSVGPGRGLELPSEAARVARDGDVIEIDAAEYFGDVAVWRANNLTLRGVGGVARLDAGGRSAQGKAIWVIKGDNVLVENIEFSNAAVPNRNGAGIRIEGADLTIRNCIFRDNENGVLGGGKQPDSSILIEYSEFSGNGYGDGLSHGIYIGSPIKRLTFRYNYVHHSKVGHQVKSRARENFILYNKLVDEESGTSSYAIDLPAGGFAVVMGNVVQQGRSTENSALVHFASAHARPGEALYLVNNTVVNERHAGVFLRNRSSVEVRLLNNVLVGNIRLVAGRGTRLGNIRLDLADFVDPGAYDFRLRPQAAAIDAAANPGEVAGGSLRLTPSDEYVHPRASRKRPQVGRLDAGAFEFQPAEQ